MKNAMQEAIEIADANLNNCGLPTYSELLALVKGMAWLRPGDEMGSSDLAKIKKIDQRRALAAWEAEQKANRDPRADKAAGPFPIAKLDAEQIRRVRQSIAECDAFIEKEEKRSADLRPADMAKHLEFCKQHKIKLLAMLAA